MLEADQLAHYTAMIVGGFCARNEVPTKELPALISSVHGCLLRLDDELLGGNRQPPAVDPETAVTRDAIYCLECGEPLKMLKRHLMQQHSITPHEYRKRWRLPGDYPLTAEAYVNTRSDMAKENGLGTKKREARLMRAIAAK